MATIIIGLAFGRKNKGQDGLCPTNVEIARIIKQYVDEQKDTQCKVVAQGEVREYLESHDVTVDVEILEVRDDGTWVDTWLCVRVIRYVIKTLKLKSPEIILVAFPSHIWRIRIPWRKFGLPSFTIPEEVDDIGFPGKKGSKDWWTWSWYTWIPYNLVGILVYIKRYLFG